MKLGKKAYNGLMAFFLFNGVASIITGIFVAVLMFSNKEASGGGIGLLVLLSGIAQVALVTLIIKKNVSDDMLKKVWLSCLGSGLKIYIKIGMIFTLILIPLAIKMSTGYMTTGYTDNGDEVWLKEVRPGVYRDMGGTLYQFK